MYPQTHLLFPLFIGELLAKLGYVEQRFVLVAVFVGVFIDIDHLLKHLYLTGELSIRKTWNAGIVKHEQDRTFLHHLPAIMTLTVVFAVLCLYYPYWTLAVALGYYSHMLLDHISLKRGFVDYITTKESLGFWKPVKIKIRGFQIQLARHDIALDVLLIIGLIIIML